MVKQSGKRVFMGLLVVSVIFLAACSSFFIYFSLNPENSFFQTVMMIIGLALAVLLIYAGLGILFVSVSIWRKKSLAAPGRMFLRGALKLYPLAIFIGRIFGIDVDDIRSSFVEINNQLVHSLNLRLKPQEIVLLTPHCLQNSNCTVRVTEDISNCKCCGQCDIGDILKIKNGLGINAVVATGGSVARNCLKYYKPKAVIAVACERELASGIIDIGNLPGLAVKNLKPNGPCKNTRVDMPQIIAAIDFFCKIEDNKYNIKLNDSSAVDIK